MISIVVVHVDIELAIISIEYTKCLRCIFADSACHETIGGVEKWVGIVRWLSIGFYDWYFFGWGSFILVQAHAHRQKEMIWLLKFHQCFVYSNDAPLRSILRRVSPRFSTFLRRDLKLKTREKQESNVVSFVRPSTDRFQTVRFSCTSFWPYHDFYSREESTVVSPLYCWCSNFSLILNLKMFWNFIYLSFAFFPLFSWPSNILLINSYLYNSSINLLRPFLLTFFFDKMDCSDIISTI